MGYAPGCIEAGVMPRNKHTREQIIGKLREAEVEQAQGKSVPQARFSFESHTATQVPAPSVVTSGL